MYFQAADHQGTRQGILHDSVMHVIIKKNIQVKNWLDSIIVPKLIIIIMVLVQKHGNPGAQRLGMVVGKFEFNP